MPQKTILVVDDEPQILSLFDEVLRRSGYECVVAEDGEAALRRLKESRPDAVFLDLKFPGENGVKILERIRQSYPSVPVVIITAYPRDILVDNAMKLGAFACLVKPFSMSSVIAVLAALDVESAA